MPGVVGVAYHFKKHPLVGDIADGQTWIYIESSSEYVPGGHNDFANLQGGTSDPNSQYFHLTETQHTALTAITGLATVKPGAVSSGSSGQVGTSSLVAHGDHNHDLGDHTHSGTGSGGPIPHSNLTEKGTNTHAQIDTHLEATNPHSESASDADLAVVAGDLSTHTGASNPHSGSAATADLTAHTGAAHPHSEHEDINNKGAASGYASLDADGRVPVAQVVYGTPTNLYVATWDNTNSRIIWTASGGGGLTEAQVMALSQQGVVLTRTDANTITLETAPGESGKILVNATVQSVATPQTIDTDSASDYLISESGGTVSIGSTALGSLTTGYNDYSLLYAYMTDASACWNFSSPTVKDYRDSLIISDKAPTETGGYMASSGDGVGARHVGYFCLNSSRQTDHEGQVYSAFNPRPATVNLVGSTASYQTVSGEDPAEDCTTYMVVPDTSKLISDGNAYFKNGSTTGNAMESRIKYDSTEKRKCLQYLVTGVTGQLIGGNAPIAHHEGSSSTAVILVGLYVYEDGTGGSTPEYYPARSWLNITRVAKG